MLAPYSTEILRMFALHTHGLGVGSMAFDGSSFGGLVSLVRRLGAVQIDTLQMVARSQYLVLWTRLGVYSVADFDDLLFDGADRQLYEFWYHAACVIPLSEYRYGIPRMVVSGRRSQWLHEKRNRALTDAVRDRITNEGPLSSADFADDQVKRGSWWDWKPAKYALSILFDLGEIMVCKRVNFRRYYDLTERVLPGWVDTTPPSWEEMVRHHLERAVLALGVCLPTQAGDYTHMKRTQARPIVDALVDEGVFAEIEGQLYDGTITTLIVHRDSLPDLERVAAGEIQSRHTTFLSPFDSLFWARGRDEQFWGFKQVLEAYKPARDRKWGYFCLPILYQDRLIGRFDPKLERKTGVLKLKAVHLEPGVKPNADMVEAIAQAMRDFMAFHNATELVVEYSTDKPFATALHRAVKGV